MKIIAIVVLMLAAFLAPFWTTRAVHDAGVFELDGNIADDVAVGTDWAALFGAGDPGGNELPLPSGAIDSGFVHDEARPDTTTYTTGSKDTLDIAGGWQCKTTTNPTDKDDIMHAYSVAIVPSSGNKAGRLLIYGAFERFDNSGAADVGFWILKDSTVGCVSAGGGGGTDWSGAHVVGDILVVAEFTTGGTVTTLRSFEWVGGTSPLMELSSGVDCASASAADLVCARVNTDPLATPWANRDKDSAANTVATSEFFEVGIDVNGLLGLGPGVVPCFNRFLFDTRTAPSPTATLKDFTVGTLVTCGSLSWTKFDNDSHLLGGATFEVCGPAFNPCASVVDNGPLDKDPALGKFKLENLFTGTYTVRETVAPPGFIPDPDTITVTLTEDNPNVVIPEAFVDPRPVLKLTEFGYTNTPSDTPASGPVSGVTLYTVKVKNFGGATTDLNGSLTVTIAGAGSGTFSCAGAGIVDCVLPIVIGSIGPGQETTFMLTLTYNDLADQAVVTAALDTITYRTNGLARNVSGTPATISFTIQAN